MLTTNIIIVQGLEAISEQLKQEQITLPDRELFNNVSNDLIKIQIAIDLTIEAVLDIENSKRDNETMRQ